MRIWFMILIYMIMIYKFNEYYSTLRYPKKVSYEEFMNKKQTHRMIDFFSI